jgi:4-diphosphocytidyl-2C-methyl-D-erythritol kinase
MLEADAFATWGGIARLGGNDFEVPVFGQEPVLREWYEQLCSTRPLLARLSGSGSALVGIYRTVRDRDGAAMELAGPGRRLVATMTRSTPAPGPTPA